jgi:hypothetical protein
MDQQEQEVLEEEVVELNTGLDLLKEAQVEQVKLSIDSYE